jgi:hypothetical protein
MIIKKWLISKLGGVTQEEHQKDVQDKINLYRKDLFRVGDLVYVNNGIKNPHYQYYLIESYSNGYCWIVGTSMDYKGRRHLTDGVHINEMSLEPYRFCKTCNQVLQSKTK